MASEILAVPEQRLEEVIRVIRAGLKAVKPPVSKDVENNLLLWCHDEEEYLKRLEG